jgi:hypothetical protein
MSVDAGSLSDRILRLTREETMEAALALSDELAGDASAPDSAKAFLEEVRDAPLRNLEVTEELARLVLQIAAADSELEPTVREVLDSVGTKAFILGGLEIVALAALAVAALHIIISKGRTADTEIITVKLGPDGQVAEVITSRNQTFGVSTRLGDLVSAVAG